MIDHVFLLMAMGVAAAGVLCHSLAPSRRRSIRYFAVVVWYGLFLVLLLLTRPGPSLTLPLVEGVIDFGGAAALHVSLAAFLAGAGGRDTVRPAAGAPALWAAVLIVAWTLWLVSLDGRMSIYTFELVANAIAFGIGGAVAGMLAGALRRQGIAGLLRGTVAGLAAGTAAAASVALIAALSLGLVAGVLSALLPGRLNPASKAPWTGLVMAAGIGGAAGLLGLGLVDERAGFLMGGQPQLLIAQAAVVVSALAASAIAGRMFARIPRETEEPPA